MIILEKMELFRIHILTFVVQFMQLRNILCNHWLATCHVFTYLLTVCTRCLKKIVPFSKKLLTAPWWEIKNILGKGTFFGDPVLLKGHYKDNNFLGKVEYFSWHPVLLKSHYFFSTSSFLQSDIQNDVFALLYHMKC